MQWAWGARSVTFCVFMSIKRRVRTARQKIQRTYNSLRRHVGIRAIANVVCCYWSQRCNPETIELWRHKTLNAGFSFKLTCKWSLRQVFNRFYRLEIHSLIGWYFQPSLWTVAPMDEGTILVYCCPSAVPSLWPPPPSPPFPMYRIYRQCVTVGGRGGVEMYCGPYSIIWKL